MTKLFEEEEKRAASHEAGHAVISVHLEVPFECVEINADGEGIVHLPSGVAVDESVWRELARRQVIVAYAGAAAQRMLHPDQHESEISQCSRDDRDKIQNIATEFPDVEIGEGAETRARLLVQEFREVIEKTANALMRKRKLTFEEVKIVYSTGDTLRDVC